MTDIAASQSALPSSSPIKTVKSKLDFFLSVSHVLCNPQCLQLDPHPKMGYLEIIPMRRETPNCLLMSSGLAKVT